MTGCPWPTETVTSPSRRTEGAQRLSSARKGWRSAPMLGADGADGCSNDMNPA
jgi:hypothetical protein